MRVIEGFMMLFYMIFAILLFFEVGMSFNIQEGIKELNKRIDGIQDDIDDMLND